MAVRHPLLALKAFEISAALVQINNARRHGTKRKAALIVLVCPMK